MSSNNEVPPIPPDPGTGVWIVGSLNTGGDARGIKGFIINQSQYAFLADGSKGLEIIGLSDAANPTLISNYNTFGFAKEVIVDTVNGIPYAFVSDNINGLYILNVANPASPQLDTLLRYYSGANSSFRSNGYLYVSAEVNKIITVNISGLPVGVSEVGRYSAYNYVEHIEVSSNAAYLAEKTNGLEIVNISNPALLARLSLFNTSSSCNDVRVAGSIAYVADGTAGINVINVGNPAQPYFLHLEDTHTNVKGLDYSPNFLFTAENDGGVSVWNLFNPALPEFVGYVTPLGYCYAVHYFKGKILTANGQRGFLVLKF